MNSKLSSLLTLAAAIVIISCKPTIPKHIIQPDDMEDILYDCYVSDGMANLDYDSIRYYNARLYRLAVLKKHGVTEAEFDSSMVYYTRHADKLYDIYVSLSERLGNEAEALGADVSNVSQYSVERGEAANVWTGERSYVFLPKPPYNLHSFRLPVDTSYHKGDRLVMEFDADFLYQDGMRDGVAMLVVRFENDSIVKRLMHMSSPTHYTLEIYDDKMLGFKDVRGMIYLNRPQNSTETTLKVMVLSNIRIMRLHEAEKQKQREMLDEMKRDSSARVDDRPVDGPPDPNHHPPGTPPPDRNPQRPPEPPPGDRPMDRGDRPMDRGGHPDIHTDHGRPLPPPDVNDRRPGSPFTKDRPMPKR